MIAFKLIKACLKQVKTLISHEIKLTQISKLGLITDVMLLFYESIKFIVKVNKYTNRGHLRLALNPNLGLLDQER